MTRKTGIDVTETATRARPLKILMVAPQPFFRPRGTPFSVLHRIRALVEQGHSVDLVTYPFGDDISLPNLRIVRSKRPPFVRDVKIGPSFSKLMLDVPLYFSARKCLSEFEYDVLHTHEEAAFFGVGMARKKGIPHVYDMHSSLSQQLANFEAYNFSVLKKLFKSLERYVIENSAGVITICPELADVALPLCDGKPHAMIENTGDDTKIFGTSRRNVREEFDIPNAHIVLYTGTLEPYQGIDLLIESFAIAASQRDGLHLLIVGGTNQQISHYRNKASQRGLEHQVTFTGMVSPMDIPSFVHAADQIASTRISGTNTPLKIYGYLRSRKPIVATNLTTHTQVLTPSVAALVSPVPDEFGSAIARLANDPDERQRLADAAFRLSEEGFSDSQYVERVTGFYGQLPLPASA